MARDRIVISAIFRPHITDQGQYCWCRPRLVECECGDGCGDVMVHTLVEVRPDERPRMSCYSEQRSL